MSRKGPQTTAVLPARCQQLLVLDRTLKLLSIMSDHWFTRFAGRFDFPQNYTTVDTETNGVATSRSHICAIGHTVVRDGKIASTSESYLNWPKFPDIDQEQFQHDLHNTQVAMESKGKPFHHTWEKLRNEGRDPLEVLSEYLDLFESMEERREVAVMHNGWRFDVELLQAHFHNWLRIPFVFDPELVYDTGICEKASQLEDYDDPLPLAGETMQQFAWRISSLRRRGIFWALDTHCDHKYRLFEKAGLDRGLAHAAGADSVTLYHLMEEHRKLAGVAKHVDLSIQGPQQIMPDDA